MFNFKDAVKQDIQNTFLNIKEFADKHVINDKDVYCVVDKMETRGADARTTLEGVFVNAVTIYAKDGDLPCVPVEGEILYLDYKMYIVRSVSVEMGMLVIVAEVYAQ